LPVLLQIALGGALGAVLRHATVSLAARLFGAGEAMREAIGASVLFYLVDYDSAVAAARDALGEEALAAAWAQGREMTPEQALAYALDEPPAVEAKASSTLLRIFAMGPARVYRGEHDLAPPNGPTPSLASCSSTS